MTEEHRAIFEALRRVTMVYASGDKGRRQYFAYLAFYKPDQALTTAEEGILYSMLHKYRKQIPITHGKYCPFCKGMVIKK